MGELRVLRQRRASRTLVPDVTVTVNRSLGEAPIERAGIKRDRDGLWVGGEERRTSVIAEEE